MKKPSDLFIPFSFDERKPCLLDKFFIVPTFYDEHEKWGKIDLSQKEIFTNKNQINVEYCSGNGQWILEKAKENEEINWIAIEMKFERAKKIWLKMKKMELNNLFIVFGEANCFTKNYLSDDSISNIFVNFPDPWPKKRHIKHRLVTIDFMNETSRIVKKGGIATLVTDDDLAQKWMFEASFASNRWSSIYEDPFYVNYLENYGSSYFEALWRDKGKEIKYMQFSNLK